MLYLRCVLCICCCIWSCCVVSCTVCVCVCVRVCVVPCVLYRASCTVCVCTFFYACVLLCSFTQVVASATPISTAGAAFIIQGKRLPMKSLLLILGMCAGCAMTVKGEVNFHPVGFLSIVCASKLT